MSHKHAIRPSLRRFACLLLGAGLLIGCAAPPPGSAQSEARSSPPPLRACDDGGSGGVMIDGVCL